MLFSPEDFAKALANAPKVPGAFVEAGPAPEPIEPYFAEKEHLSRSGILRLEALLKGKTEYTPPPDFVFAKGKMFDRYFTEPDKFDPAQYSAWDLGQLLQAERALRIAASGMGNGSFEARAILGIEADGYKYTKQKEIYRTIEVGGYKVKAKIKVDVEAVRPGKRIAIDIKSTTKRTYNEFVADVVKHSLDLQASWYTDVGRYDEFAFVGISYLNEHHALKAMQGDEALKKALLLGPQIYIVELSAKTIERARRRYQKIIIDAKTQGIL